MYFLEIYNLYFAICSCCLSQTRLQILESFLLLQDSRDGYQPAKTWNKQRLKKNCYLGSILLHPEAAWAQDIMMPKMEFQRLLSLFSDVLASAFPTIRYQRHSSPILSSPSAPPPPSFPIQEGGGEEVELPQSASWMFQDWPKTSWSLGSLPNAAPFT